MNLLVHLQEGLLQDFLSLFLLAHQAPRYPVQQRATPSHEPFEGCRLLLEGFDQILGHPCFPMRLSHLRDRYRSLGTNSSGQCADIYHVVFATERRKHPPHFQSSIAVEVDELPPAPLC